MDDFDVTPQPQPEPAADLEETDAYDEYEDASDSPPARAGRGESRPDSDRARRTLKRRTAVRAVKVCGLDRRRQEVLGALIGSPCEPVSLTVASLDAGRPEREALARIREIAKADDMTAGVTAVTLLETPKEARTVWSVAVALGSELPAVIPTASSKAGLSLARAIKALSKADLALLDDIEKAIG